MTTPSLSHFSVRFSDYFELEDINWKLEPGQHWLVMGPNGSGKSALAALLAGEGTCLSGSRSGLPARVATVSFELQAALIERERKRDDSDETDLLASGTAVRDILLEHALRPEDAEDLIARFQLQPLLDQGFRKLSTGESRKVLLIRALLSQPELLILDEPFDGLDKASTAQLAGLLSELAHERQLVLVLNRFDEIPDFASHMVWMDKPSEQVGGLQRGRILKTLALADRQALADLQQLSHLQRRDLQMPGADPATRAPALVEGQPLVRMKNIKVVHSGDVLFDGLDFCVDKGQHWQISGPNGSGKSTLLNLISGDHPQCYVNDIFVFGHQRGNGETIWQIKQNIGYVSASLQWDYRVSISARMVIISGFFDSIGVYQSFSDIQANIADSWLALLGMSDKADESFRQLSYGDQRLLLIARAMVKHPPLLILDEPCQGLDEMNRQLILALIAKVCAQSETTVLYVNHHEQDRIEGIEHHLTLGA